MRVCNLRKLNAMMNDLKKQIAYTETSRIDNIQEKKKKKKRSRIGNGVGF